MEALKKHLKNLQGWLHIDRFEEYRQDPLIRKAEKTGRTRMVFELPMKTLYRNMRKRMEGKTRELAGGADTPEEQRLATERALGERLGYYSDKTARFKAIGHFIGEHARSIDELEEQLKKRKLRHSIDDTTGRDVREAIAPALLAFMDRVKKAGIEKPKMTALETELNTTVSENMVPYVELVVSCPTEWAKALEKAGYGSARTRWLP